MHSLCDGQFEGLGNTQPATAQTDQAELNIEQARSLRAYRQLAARQLVALAESVDTQLQCDLWQGCDRQVLDTLPRWVVMDDPALRELQRICGAVFSAPSLQRCIDGATLKAWRTMLGASLIEEVWSLSFPAVAGDIPPLPEANEKILLDTGASVLLSTVTAPPVRQLLRRRFDDEPVPVDALTAGIVHSLALDIHQRLLAEVDEHHRVAGDAETQSASADAPELKSAVAS